MQRLTEKGHHVDVQILDNEVSTEFKKTIVDDWDATYQLVPTNVHRRNIAERAIRTSKSHFISVLAYVGKPLGPNITDNQPSSASHTQPKHVSMGIFQWYI